MCSLYEVGPAPKLARFPWEETPEGHFYTMLTTSPSEQMAAIHNRMPVLLRAESFDSYLENPDDASDLLVPFSGPLEIAE